MGSKRRALVSWLGLMAVAGASASAREQGPSVLLITLDTTRADRIGAYGHADAVTPTLDRLAREGALYLRAYASCPLTIPSHATILTGQPPPVTGVRDNGDFLLQPDAHTLAEMFSEAGWTTAAFTAAFPTQARWGFDQGFSVYHDPLTRLPAQLDWRDQRRANEVVDDAMETLDGLDGPAFVWVHLFDPHWPYDPPEPQRSMLANRPYDGEIAFMDAQLGRLLRWWDRRYPTSLVAVTADHGEALGDGGEQTHGFLLHDGTLRVPLILRGVGIAAGTTVDTPVGHVDLAPTLLAIAGLPIPATLPGTDLRSPTESAVYSEALTGLFALGISPLVVITDEDGRYTEGTWGGWYPAEGTTVSTEPVRGGPMLDVAASGLHRMLDALPDHRATNAGLSPSELARLTALGYVGGAGVEVAADVDPRDVIGLIPLMWHAERHLAKREVDKAAILVQRMAERMGATHGVRQLQARILRAQGRPFAAIHLLRTLFYEAPSSAQAQLLGGILAEIGDWQEAELWFTEALSLQPASAKAMAGLVRAAQAQGVIEVARQRAEQFLATYPDHLELVLVQAELLLMDGRFDEALETSQWAVSLAPYRAATHALHGRALWHIGHSDAAVDAFWEALAIEPNHLGNRLQYVDALLDMGRNAEALRAIEQVAIHLAGMPAVEARLARSQAALTAERRRTRTP
jgi:choline-sulfatase